MLGLRFPGLDFVLTVPGKMGPENLLYLEVKGQKIASQKIIGQIRVP